MILISKPDGSVESRDGSVVYFSFARFEQDILRGGCCFVCGASPGSRRFNNEHIIPRWILNRFHLFNRRVTLPNGTGIPYKSYTVPCCVECNGALNDAYEKPVRRMLEGGRAAIDEHLRSDGWLLFAWLALLFVKTHLKDWSLRFERDSTMEDREHIAASSAARRGTPADRPRARTRRRLASWASTRLCSLRCGSISRRLTSSGGSRRSPPSARP